MGALLNVIGLGAAVALYATLLVMVVRAGRAPLSRTQSDPLLVATAVLGLIWNLCALPSYALARLGMVSALPWLTLVGTSALGFLPAVVVHSVLRGGQATGRRRMAPALLLLDLGDRPGRVAEAREDPVHPRLRVEAQLLVVELLAVDLRQPRDERRRRTRLEPIVPINGSQ